MPAVSTPPRSDASDGSPPTLTPVQEKFVLHWGEMGARWGINRTVAQIHALLYLSPEPMNAEAITATLGVARSNVSTSLKELQGWGIVKVIHVLGDRRDHFECLKDVWEMFETILDERKRREIDPTILLLKQCADEAAANKQESDITRARIGDLLDFMQTMDAWYRQLRNLPRPAMLKFVKLGRKLPKALGLSQ